VIKLWLIYVLIAHAKSANELIINNYWIQAPAIAQSKFALNESVQTKNDIIFGWSLVLAKVSVKD